MGRFRVARAVPNLSHGAISLLVGLNDWACVGMVDDPVGTKGGGAAGRAGAAAQAGMAGGASGMTISAGASGMTIGAGASGMTGNGGTGGNGGAGGAPACDAECHAVVASANCSAARVLWACGPIHPFVAGWQAQCTALPTPQPTYCCAPEFLVDCY